MTRLVKKNLEMFPAKCKCNQPELWKLLDYCGVCGLEWQWGMDKFDRDHIKARGGHPELLNNPANINILCRGCHLKKHGVRI